MNCTAIRHGSTRYAYTAFGCRCPAAVAAMRVARKRHETSRGSRYQPTGRRAGWSNTNDPHVDPVAVARACLGDRGVRLTPAERTAAVARLSAGGWSIVRTAQQLGISDQAVLRHRAKLAAATERRAA
jgi:hypothetical protein